MIHRDRSEKVNTSFLSKAIDKAQSLHISNPFCKALSDYIFRACPPLFYKDLVWVKHPNGGWQVAIWLIIPE